jgi:hypothetical protein
MSYEYGKRRKHAKSSPARGEDTNLGAKDELQKAQ